MGKQTSWFRIIAEMTSWLLIAVLAAGIFLTATSSGIGLVSDSFFYIGGSEGIINGEGFARPAADGSWKTITHFPPLYSALLAIPGYFLPMTDAAEVLNLVLFVVNALLAAHLVLRTTGHRISGILAAIVWSLSPVLLKQQVSVLSEGLFFIILLLWLLQMLQYTQTRRWGALVVTGILVGLAYLTRYAGAALIIPGILFILFDSRSKIGDRLGRFLMFLCTGLLFPVVWAIRNFLLTGSTSNRVFAWHPVSGVHAYNAADTVVRWLSPIDLPGLVEIALLGILLFALGVIFLAGLVRQSRGGLVSRERSSYAMLLLSGSILAYLSLLVISISFFDASTPLDDRILSPVYAWLVLMLFTFVGKEMARGGKSLFRMFSLSLVVFLSVWLGYRGIRTVRESAKYPAGFAGQTWQDSPVVDYVRHLDAGTLLYSNEIDGLYLLTGRMAYLIPVQWDPVSLQEREDYPERLETMRNRLMENEGALVLFSTLSRQDFFPDEEVLSEGLTPVVEEASGSIYRGGDSR